MKFADIPGHEEAKARLRAMADSDRIPHALLLEGRSGIGKFALARAFMQYVHCTNKQDGDSCGRCPSCQQHQSFNHIDSLFCFPILKTVAPSGRSDDLYPLWREFISGAKTKPDRGEGMFMSFPLWMKIMGNPAGQPLIYSDESTRITQWFATTSYSTRYKIMLMWLPERMQPECANKLLKLVEEPLEDSLLIFVSDTPQEILPTIYSRLQRVKVRRYSEDEVYQYLIAHGDAPADTATEAARLAGGSILEGLRRIDIAESNDEQLQMFQQLMRLAYQRRIGDLRLWAEKLAAKSREQILSFIDYSATMIRENFIYNLQLPEIRTLNKEEEQFASRFAPFVNEANTQSLLEQIEQARIDIAGNGNSKMVLFHLAVLITLLLRRK